MNKLIIIGNLTRDPETRTAKGGGTACSFVVAVNRRRSPEGQPEADFFRVAAWNKLGDVCQRYLEKGRKVCVTGAVSVSSYEGKDGSTRYSLDVRAEDVEFLTPSKPGSVEGRTPPQPTPGDDGYSDADEDAQYSPSTAGPYDDKNEHSDDDDLPF